MGTYYAEPEERSSWSQPLGLNLFTWTYDGETGNYMSTMTFEKSALPATL
jgi:hypothetical protein